MATKADRQKRYTTIGWREWIGLPEFNINRIKAKIDTGARTSAIHAFRIRKFEQDDQPWAEFFLHPIQRKREPQIRCVAQIVDERAVTSSNGERELRYVIKTPVRLGENTWPIEITLSNRDQMGFRLLIGRTAIRGKCTVDPGASFLLGR